MAKTKISEWSSTPASNTDIDGINIAEGCPPSGINDAIRELMSQVKDLYSGTTGDAIAIAGGGTGSTTASGARTNLGLGSVATESVVPVAKGGTGATDAQTAKANLSIYTSDTGSAIIPTGTQAQRDGTPATGYFRFNTTVSKFEGYNGTSWGSVGGGATGGGSDAVFIENDQTVNNNYTITANKNAGTFGPVTVAAGVTVTVPSGSVWTVI